LLIGIGMIAGTQFLHRVARKIDKRNLVSTIGAMGIAVFFTAVFGRIWSTALGMLGWALAPPSS